MNRTMRLVLGWAAGWASLGAGAATHPWPGSAPCNGTLQACIDAAAENDRIIVRQSGTVASGLNLNGKGLELVVADGIDAVIGAGGIVNTTSPHTGTLRVRIEGFRVEGGRIILAYYGTGHAEYRVLRNRVVDSTHTALPEIEVRSSGASTRTLDVLIEDNHVIGNTYSLSGAINVEVSNGYAEVALVHNRVQAAMTEVEGWGIALIATGGAEVVGRVGHNHVRGRFGRGAIGIQEGIVSSPPSTLDAAVFSNVVVCDARQGNGIGVTPLDGSIQANVVLNTVVGCRRAMSYARWHGSSGSGGIEGIINSNLIAFNDYGYSLNPEYFTTITRGYNLVHGNDINQPAPEDTAVLADPQLYSIQHPYLRAGSPAIGAANGFAPLVWSGKLLDADGMRRYKGVGLDIGAYEYGDVFHRHLSAPANTSGRTTELHGMPMSTTANIRPFAVAVRPGLPFVQPFGVALGVSGFWSIFTQNAAVSMPAGVYFDVFAPLNDSASFVHHASAANTSGRATTIENSQLNARPEKFVLATQNFLGTASGGSGVYNAHPIGVRYNPAAASGTGRWEVWNVDSPAPMPDAARFHVYTQERSPNAFLATATTTSVMGQALYLDHPLLNGTPCAVPQATLVYSDQAGTTFELRYMEDEQRWAIIQHNVPSMPLGQAYMVLVSPRQVLECAGPLFSDGFE